MESSSPTGPRRLSWGRSTSQRQTSRPQTSSSLSVGHADIKHEDSSGTAAGISSEPPCRDQQHQRQQLQSSHTCDPQLEQQACKLVLREVLSAVLGESGPQLDHFQLTLPAVLAVVQHKLTEAANAGHSKATAGAAAAVKQQVAAAQKEAEAKASKQLQDITDQAAAAAAQHSHEVSGLQAQLAALQRQNKQLQGKSAQQARDLRETTEAAKAAQAAQQQSLAELQELKKQLQGKAAALSRSTSVRQQEAAALKAELQHTAAAAEAVAAQHQRTLQQLQEAHAQELAQLKLQHMADCEQQLQESTLAHQRQQTCLVEGMQQQLGQELAAVNVALLELREQQQEAAEAVGAAQADCMQEASVLASHWQQQLQEVRLDLCSARADAQELLELVSSQHAALCELREQQAALDPPGLQVLAQQAQEAAAARRDHAAALQQLQETSLQLSTLQPMVQQLQQRQQGLEQERDALQAQLQHAISDSTAHQQQVADLQQQLEIAQGDVQQLRQQLQASVADLAAVRQEAAASHKHLSSQAAAAEEMLAQASGRQHAALQELEVAFCGGLRHVQERLVWLCSTYFIPETAPPAASSSSTAAATPPRQDRVPATHEASTAYLFMDTGAAECETVQGTSTGATAGGLSKLHQLSGSLAGDGERLLQLFEQYKVLKQQVLTTAVRGDASTCSSSTTPCSSSNLTHSTEGIRPEPQAAAAAAAAAGVDMSLPSPVLQVQQQVLQLEACLLKFMLSLQEALDEAKQPQQRRLSSSLFPAGNSSSRPERPSTAMSCSSRCTDATSISSGHRSSSLTGQLLASMRREKQQLAQELRKMHTMQRTPLAALASLKAFPWQRSSQLMSPRGQTIGNNCGSGAAASSSSTAQQGWPSACGGQASGSSTAQWAAQPHVGAAQCAEVLSPSCQQEGWEEEVDFVLQLLQGCHLPGLPVRGTQAACTAGSSSTSHGGIKGLNSSCSGSPSKQQQAGSSPQCATPAVCLQQGSSRRVAAAGVGSSRSPGRSVSIGHGVGRAGLGTSLTQPASPNRRVLQHSQSCAQPTSNMLAPHERGLASLRARS